MSQKKAIIIGAGPAGLTAAYELLSKTDIKPIVYERTGDIGGISKTVNYKGNRIDIGGHRFFSKSDRIMQWWTRIFPIQVAPSKDDWILERKTFEHQLTASSKHSANKSLAADPEKSDEVMLIRNRLSRIFFLRKFFKYPVSLEMSTIWNLGLVRIVKIGFSYIKIRLFPIKHEKSLEDFFMNRFGKELYLTFFKDYTEKVWGVPCSQIKPEWGAQRVKGLSITKAIVHAVKGIFPQNKSLRQKNIETSLIEQFLYPKYGPGQIWEEVARIIEEKGGQVLLNHTVKALKVDQNHIFEAEILNEKTGETITQNGDYFFSTMPVRELIPSLGKSVPMEVRHVAEGLVYRDFITVGMLLKKMRIKNQTMIATVNNIVPDTWIYIQERDVKVGRLQVFNNWSPYMVKDDNTIWIGLEYFCTEGDGLWRKSDEEFKEFAVRELVKIDMVDPEDVLDSVVIRVPKTYPAYFGTYDQFDVIRNYTDTIQNLYLIGRNGMHRYNNADHSMLTAIVAVENILNGIETKDNIWDVNTEQEYHEAK